MIDLKYYDNHYLSNFLINFVKTYKVESYMEIGVNAGRSLMAVVASNPHLKTLYVVDNWSGKHGGSNWRTHNHIDTKLKAAGYKYDTIYLDGDSQYTIPKYHKHHPEMCVDLCNVDGNHNYDPAWQDLTNVEKFAKAILLDDVYHTGHKHLADAWDKFLDYVEDKQNDKLRDFIPYTGFVYDGNGIGWAVLKQLEKLEQNK